MKCLLKPIYVVAIAGILLAGLSAVLLFIDKDNSYADAFGTVSTIISIVLGLVSIVYTYQSSKELSSTLDEIRNQYRSLVTKINSQLIEKNFGEVNDESLLRKD